MRFVTTIIFILVIPLAHAQTLGGNAAFNFLKFSFTPQVSAAGGVNISQAARDPGFAVHNPALLHQGLHQQLGINFTEFSGIHGYNLAGAWHSSKQATTWGASVFYLDYGSLQQTDASGNMGGNFRAADYVLQVSGARRYLEKWQYGFSVKFIRSAYEQYRSTGVAADAGLLYSDTSRLISISILAKNMGVQIKNYGGTPEDLPFDLQAGITKKLEKAPFAFSLTLQQMHRYNLVYNDTLFNQENNFNTSHSFFSNLFHHVVLATHIYFGRHLEATIGYNRLRRAELNLGTTGNGLTGFSAGFSARFEKFHISYGRSSYQKGIAFNQFGINLIMNRFFGTGGF